MTTLEVKTLDILAAHLGKTNTLPMLANLGNRSPWLNDVPVDETDEIYIDCGCEHHGGFPYQEQNHYDRELTAEPPQCVVLENAHLRAEFVPALGGRLWSLYDKDRQKDLLFRNPVFQPGNLAIRNAWFSGGVEWNCGAMVGHHPNTCEPVHTAVTHLEDGTPVLRMYYYERIRCVVNQMDFWLPEDSGVLFCRMRVVNDFAHSTAMYWWSNIAVPHADGARTVVPAHAAFVRNKVVRGDAVTVEVGKVAAPMIHGVDVSYPDNNPVSVDYFWSMKQAPQPYVCHLDSEGYGLYQTSTRRLQGRKLFVWGQGRGGDHWQEYLSGGGCDGKYCEIQAGLATSQYEMIPMAPRTAWEWVEIYGAMNADASEVHGTWEAAQNEVRKRMDEICTPEELDGILQKTHAMAVAPADRVLFRGNGWGALENARRAQKGEKPLCAHLDFGTTGAAQQQWIDLLENGSFGTRDGRAIPPSYMSQREWRTVLREAIAGKDAENWYTHYQLGLAQLSEGENDAAEKTLIRAAALEENAWTELALAALYRASGDTEKSLEAFRKSASYAPENADLALEVLRALNAAKRDTEILEFAANLSAEMQQLPRIRLIRGLAAGRLGKIDLAEEALYGGGGLVIPDLREAEESISELWFAIEESRRGEKLDRKSPELPAKLDFRMFA